MSNTIRPLHFNNLLHRFTEDKAPQMDFLPPTRTLHSLRQGGFSLIELLVAMAVVGILSAIAYPSYVEYVNKGRRADALRTALELEQYMRRYYAAKDTFKDVDITKLPKRLQQSPSEGAAAYTVKFLEDVTSTDDEGNETTSATLVDISTSETQFTLRLTRAGAMTDDDCGDLQISHTGKRSLVGEKTGKKIENCFVGG